MKKKNWKYISLTLGGERYDYIYDMGKDEVYTQDFPGIPVETFRLSCGMIIHPHILKQIVMEKLAEYQLIRTELIKTGDLFWCISEADRAWLKPRG